MSKFIVLMGLVCASMGAYASANQTLAICGPKTHAFLPGFGEVLRVDVKPSKINVLTFVNDFRAEWSGFPVQGVTVSEFAIEGVWEDEKYLELNRTPETAFSGYVIVQDVKIDLICRD
jgi:hypothetical protein